MGRATKMARKTEDCTNLIDSLKRLGMPIGIGENDRDTSLAAINDELARIADERESKIFRKRSNVAKMPDATYLCDYRDIPDRGLDITLLKDILSLSFMEGAQKENIILWGSADTGKTWIAELISTEACRKDKRVKWTNFPTLYRELDSLRKRDSEKFEKKLTYYSKFDLLCIDEFLNYELKECFLIQELLNRITLIKRCSLLVCSQVNPFDWVKLFPATGIGESARGRIMHISKSIHLKGKDLRMEGKL